MEMISNYHNPQENIQIIQILKENKKNVVSPVSFLALENEIGFYKCNLF